MNARFFLLCHNHLLDCRKVNIFNRIVENEGLRGLRKHIFPVPDRDHIKISGRKIIKTIITEGICVNSLSFAVRCVLNSYSCSCQGRSESIRRFSADRNIGGGYHGINKSTSYNFACFKNDRRIECRHTNSVVINSRTTIRIRRAVNCYKRVEWVSSFSYRNTI